MHKKNAFLAAGVAGLAAVLAAAAFMWLVVYHPGEAIRQENIEKNLSRESPVFYRDGVMKIGVFFQDAHRQYVPYKQLPQFFINAIIAAEDSQFFHHHGFDLPGFARAMLANIRAGKIVQGGSTITQQTAKNLFERKSRSIGAKLKELLFALRLEYHYPKEKILEFYVNQFYVSGNGRGLGVAARYYFDKEPAALDLVESAFIAGSVKSPNYYNPFIKRDEQSAALARKNARIRTAYVLGQMHKLGMISTDMYQAALQREIPFKQGKMQFRLNTLMDLVKDGLDDPAVDAALQDFGIDNVATSGARIFTTIDRKLQESSLFALQSELSELDVKLLGYDGARLQKQYADLPFGGDPQVADSRFMVARVVGVQLEPKVQVLISFAPKGSEVQGVIDEQGLKPLLTSLAQYGQKWSGGQLAGGMRPGELVYVSARENRSENREKFFNLEKYPTLQGASLILQGGRVAAMVGGMDNYYYNRAVAAKRPMGSVVKPLLYAAAIQLGWNSLDALNNERNMFVYQKNAYIPRPDHVSPNKRVSMSWAGVHSENVASVWLLYHLCDRLTPAQFKELLAGIGLARQSGESYEQYTHRIRDNFGVVVDAEALSRTAFERAVAASEADLLFEGKQDELQNLALFHYSDRYERELDKLTDEVQDNESALRQQIVSRSFVRYRNLQDQLLRECEQSGENDASPLVPNLYFQPGQGEGGSSDGRLTAGASLNYTESGSGSGWMPARRDELQRILAGMPGETKKEFLGRVRIEGQLSLSTLDLLQEDFNKELATLSARPPYEDEVLHEVRDFRVLAGLRYLISLCREMGVTSELDPVLSFPLGSNVMSLLELSRVYEALTSGLVYHNEASANPGLALIDRIEAADGELIFENKVDAKRVIDPQTVVAVSDILRNVVRFGTGRAAGRIMLQGGDPKVEGQLADLRLTVPLFGKTGTANRFTNSAFAGLVPEVRDKRDGVTVGTNGFVVASYVGFDDNRPMMHAGTHIAGATGALPIWIKMAQGIISTQNYSGALDLVDLAFSAGSEVPLFYPDVGQIAAPVAALEGGLLLPARQGEVVDKASVITFGKASADGEIELGRYFRPYWSNK